VVVDAAVGGVAVGGGSVARGVVIGTAPTPRPRRRCRRSTASTAGTTRARRLRPSRRSPVRRQGSAIAADAKREADRWAQCCRASSFSSLAPRAPPTTVDMRSTVWPTSPPAGGSRSEFRNRFGSLTRTDANGRQPGDVTRPVDDRATGWHARCCGVKAW
jgi:hypothetical protein